ncbi:hypothetical protein [Mesorhizobium sp. WSM2239]|uniref:Uncharacterized protein n=2 Tax=unclassified Mesorhizobium TaxID=325217 RepID=A0AAU8DAH0_9HYPH
MKILLATAFSVILSLSGAALAQETGATQPDALGADNQRGGGGTDASNYLTGPNIHQFYMDEGLTTLRPEAEIRTTYLALPDPDRMSLRAACETNTDIKFTDLCRAVNAM